MYDITCLFFYCILYVFLLFNFLLEGGFLSTDLFSDLYLDLHDKATDHHNDVMLKILKFIDVYGCVNASILEWLNDDAHFYITDNNFKWIVTLIQKNCDLKWFDLCWNILSDPADSAKYYKVNEIFRCIDVCIPFEKVANLFQNESVTAFKIKNFRDSFVASQDNTIDLLLLLSERLEKGSDANTKIAEQLLTLQSQFTDFINHKEKSVQKKKEIIFEHELNVPEPITDGNTINEETVSPNNISHEKKEKKKIYYIPQKMIVDETVIEKDNNMLKRKKMKFIDSLLKLKRRHDYNHLSDKDKRQLLIEKVIRKNLNVEYVSVIRDLLNNEEVGIEFLNMLVDTDADINAYKNLTLLLSEKENEKKSVNDSSEISQKHGDNNTNISEENQNSNNFNPEEVEKSFQFVPFDDDDDDFDDENVEFEEFEG